MQIADYSVIEELYQSRNTVVYRGERQTDRKPVILKLLNREYPSPVEIALFRHEYDILNGLRIRGVIKVLSLESHNNTVILVMEDTNKSRSLKQILVHGPVSLEIFLEISIRLADILAQIHEHNIIHKDINPNNIILCPETGEISLIDFGIATRLSSETQELRSANALSGTLPYISPEQTGRMNRSTDFRTDFYSLGITFYEMLSGRCPFKEKDPMGWVHAHIAKIPEPLCQRNPKIPGTISDIVMKLISKNAEDRYQSAYALKRDLVQCLEQWKETGSVSAFPIARQDVPRQLRIPQKLYGREKEIMVLMNFFDATQKKSEIILVTGYSGIGKSALVNEIKKPVTQKSGYFISGKFDQYQRNIPYSAIIQAFRDFVRHLLTETRDEIQAWKEKLLKSLGTNGQVIIDVIPEIELIVGRQPLAVQLGPSESRNRFNMVFLDFISVFTKKEHPLAVFLDDLQWADPASLDLIQILVTNSSARYIFMIGAYRDKEVDKTHPLAMAMDKVQNTRTFHRLVLKPLQPDHIEQLVCETLLHEPGTCGPLARLITNKTGGNPFFINEFLKSLYRRKMLSVDLERGQWQWDLKKIKEQNITDNVVDLMVDHIRELPRETRDVLKTASCIGNSFRLDVLALVYEHSLADTIADMWQAVEQGLVISSADLDRLRKEETDVAVLRKIAEETVSFLHDRVHQAAYSLIPEDKKKEVHLKIGRLLLENTPEQTLEDNIFGIVNHLNIGKELITKRKERVKLSELNLMAGKKAKKSSAYQAAFSHFDTGIELLGTKSWERYYSLCFEIYRESSECAYLSGKFEKGENQIRIMLAHLKTPLEKAEVFYMQTFQYEVMGKLEQAIQVGIDALSILGIKFPDKPDQGSIQKELVMIKENLGKRKIAELINYPKLSNPEKKLAVKLLIEMAIYLYKTGNPVLRNISVLKMTNISLCYGHSPESAFAYAAYGLMLIKIGDLKTAYEFGKLSIALNECLQGERASCRIAFMTILVNLYIRHWNKHWSRLTPWFRKMIKAAYRPGDLDMAYHTYAALHTVIWNPKMDLKTICMEIKKNLPVFKKLKFMDMTDTVTMYQQMFLNFRGMTESLFSMNDSYFDETECLEEITLRKFTMGIARYHFMKAEIFYLHEDYIDAMIHVEKMDMVITSIAGQPVESRFCFVAFLTFAACYPGIDPDEKKQAWERLEKEHKQMKKWSDHCPVNFLHLSLLMEAVIAMLSQEPLHAAKLYDQAIEAAQENEWLRDEALGNELAAKFWLDRGHRKIARAYMKDAYYLYFRWGATAKADQLKKKYPKLIAGANREIQSSPGMALSSGSDSSTDSRSLDLNMVVKSSRSISGEIKLETLLEQLMDNIVESAGAQKGMLILEKKGRFVIEAEKAPDQSNVKILGSEPVEQSEKLSGAVINYVERTCENVVLNDAVNDGRFANDPYIVKNLPKSVLCSPIIQQGKLRGMLYLENNLSAGAFTPDRLHVVGLLSSQAAISLENARLYSNMEEKVKERTALIEKLVLSRLAHLNESVGKILSQSIPEHINEKEKDELAHFANEINVMLNALELYQGRLQTAKEEAEAASRAKSEFLANMSHEIRTPMNSILGFTEILSEQITDPNQKQYLLNILSAGKLLLILIDDILDISKIEAGKLNIVYKAFDPKLLFNEMETIISPGIAEKQVEFISEIDKNLPDRVILDEARLRQVLFNLIGNAVKFTDSGYVRMSVQCRYIDKERTRADMSFFVEDTGIGIPEDQRERIFNVFERGRLFNNSSYRGTGLGLAITKRLVESMGGSVHVTGEVGKGSRFTVIIPNVSIAGASDDTKAEDSLNPDSLVFEKASVLIVDDMKINRDLLQGMLRNYDFSFTEASNGREGLELAKTGIPDIILMDMKMPEMSGEEATEKIREDKELAHIPIIAVTASSMKEDEKQIRSFSDGYLQKPVNRKKLIRELVRFLPHSVSQAEKSQRDQDTIERTGTPEPLPDIPYMDIFDRKTALEQMDGDEELLEKYIQICLEDISEEMGKLEQALEISKTESVKIHAHTIKGMAGTMGACELYKTALELEGAGKDYDYDKARRVFKRLGQEYDRFLSVYESVGDQQTREGYRFPDK